MLKDECEVYLAASPSRFYVYVLRRSNGTPFYVGKGCGSRVFCHERDALGQDKSYKLNIIRALKRRGLPVDYLIDAFYDDEDAAHAREVQLIREIGRHDLGTGPLANLTDGGEGTCGISEETKQRHLETLCGEAAEGERGIANRFFARLLSVRSVPVKPLSKFKPERLTPHPQSRDRTERMAAALAASAIANRVLLEPGCVLPRQMTMEGTTFVVENGVGRDMLKAGLVAISYERSALDMAFVLNASAVTYVRRVVGSNILLDAGVLMPDMAATS